MANFSCADEPKDLKEALSCPVKESWIKAMEEELESNESKSSLGLG